MFTKDLRVFFKVEILSSLIFTVFEWILIRILMYADPKH